MKKIHFPTMESFTTMVIVLFLLSSCGGEDPKPTEQDKVKALLTSDGGKWSPASANLWVTVEGIDVSELFTGFTLTFTSKGYTTTGTTPVWPRTDSWKFKDKTETEFLIRNSDGKEITIEAIDETNLRITLEWDENTYEGARTKSLAGKHVFILSK